MGTGSRSLRSVPVPLSPALSRGVGKGGQARAEYVPSQSPFADRMKQPCRALATLNSHIIAFPRSRVPRIVHRSKNSHESANGDNETRVDTQDVSTLE
jgi:hypothetical protein